MVHGALMSVNAAIAAYDEVVLKETAEAVDLVSPGSGSIRLGWSMG
jgi:hypothetical protein